MRILAFLVLLTASGLAQPPEVFLNNRNNRDHQGPGSPVFDFSLASTLHLNEADKLKATYAPLPEARTIASLQVGANYYVYVQDFNQHTTCALQYLSPGHYSDPVCVSVVGARTVVLHPDGTKLYVVDSFNTIVQVDIGVPNYTALTLNPNTLRLTNTGGGNVDVHNLDITPDGKRLLAVGGFHLYEVDTKDAVTGLLKQTRDVPLPGSATASFFYPIRISPNPAKPFALIGDPDGDGVYKIDLGTLSLVRIAGPPGLGTGHTGTDKLYYTDMVFHESGNYAYAASCESTQCVLTGVGLIDVVGETLTIQGGSPNMVAYALQYNPAYHRLYVSYAYNLFGLRTFNVSADGSMVTFDTSYIGLPDLVPSLAVPQVPSTQPDLTLTKTHTGNFTQGQTTSNFQITVTNSGASPTVGTVTVTDDLSGAPGLSVVNLSGTNWVCSGTTCTRNDPLAAGANYDPIQLTVSVAGNAASPQVNHASVSGGGEVNTYNNTATDSVIITQFPDLTIVKAHVGGSFTQGQQGAQYKLTVSNGGSVATTGSITVTDMLPGGLTFASGTGAGFSCVASGQSVTCTNSATPIAAGGTAAITLNVNVSATAAASLTNTAAVACACTETSTANNTSNTDTVIVNAATVQVTVSTNISGPTVSVDGGAGFTSSQMFTWNIGSSHSLSTSTPQSGGVGKQYVWLNWGDAGAITHSVTASSGTTSYAANFKTQYVLTTQTNASGIAGTISPATGFVDGGTTAQVDAAANPGFTFTGFSGALNGNGHPQGLPMNAPAAVTANFAGQFTTLAAVIVNKSGTQPARIWPVQLTNTGSGGALAARITSLSITPVSPATCTPVITSPGSFPLMLGDIVPGGMATGNVTIDFTGCGNIDRFTTVINFSANGGSVSGSKTITQYR